MAWRRGIGWSLPLSSFPGQQTHTTTHHAHHGGSSERADQPSPPTRQPRPRSDLPSFPRRQPARPVRCVMKMLPPARALEPTALLLVCSSIPPQIPRCCSTPPCLLAVRWFHLPPSPRAGYHHQRCWSSGCDGRAISSAGSRPTLSCQIKPMQPSPQSTNVPLPRPPHRPTREVHTYRLSVGR